MTDETINAAFAQRVVVQTQTRTPHSAWARCATRARHNAVDNLVILAPAIGVAHALNVSSLATQYT